MVFFFFFIYIYGVVVRNLRILLVNIVILIWGFWLLMETTVRFKKKNEMKK